MIEKVYLKLDEILEKEKIETLISKYDENSYWYKSTYKKFINIFNETRGNKDIEEWAVRTALVYSWLPTIPLKAFSLDEATIKNHIFELEKLESRFYNKDLALIEITYDSNIKESVLSSQKRDSNIKISEFFLHAGYMIHKEPRLNTQLSSVTKLLHFMCPFLFPIFDTKVCLQIFGTKYQTYDKYFIYLLGVQQYLKKGKSNSYVKELARERNVSPLYIMDLVIFNQ